MLLVGGLGSCESIWLIQPHTSGHGIMSFIGRRVIRGPRSRSFAVRKRVTYPFGSGLFLVGRSMRPLNRVIAVIMMLVFTPASVLAGTPLRLCIGEDGHRAIEFVLADKHHADAKDDHECDDAGEHHIAPSSGCLDAPLLTDAQASQSAPAALLTIGDLLSLGVFARADLPVDDKGLTGRGKRIRTIVFRPQLPALQTIKLLI